LIGCRESSAGDALHGVGGPGGQRPTHRVNLFIVQGKDVREREATTQPHGDIADHLSSEGEVGRLVTLLLDMA